MARVQIQDLPQDEALDAAAMEQVRGGIIAILIGYAPTTSTASLGDGSVRGIRGILPYVEQDNL